MKYLMVLGMLIMNSQALAENSAKYNSKGRFCKVFTVKNAKGKFVEEKRCISNIADLYNIMNDHTKDMFAYNYRK